MRDEIRIIHAATSKLLETRPNQIRGGTAWLINKKLGMEPKVTIINDKLSYLKTKDVIIIGVYMQSNTQTSEGRTILKEQHNDLLDLFKKLKRETKSEILIFGDFNGDLNRLNSHDKVLLDLITKNNWQIIDVAKNSLYHEGTHKIQH